MKAHHEQRREMRALIQDWLNVLFGDIDVHNDFDPILKI